MATKIASRIGTQVRDGRRVFLDENHHELVPIYILQDEVKTVISALGYYKKTFYKKYQHRIDELAEKIASQVPKEKC